MTYINWFEQLRAEDVSSVGGKGANLGEMAGAGFPIPPGFCLTAQAYREFIRAAGLRRPITEILDSMALTPDPDFEATSAQIRGLITSGEFPGEIALQLRQAYRQLCRGFKDGGGLAIPVAVRSSATAEDLPTASFAGQQDTFLNVVGEADLLAHVQRCWASLWTARAISYRQKQGFDHHHVYLAVVVQAMIPSEISGILFTSNPISGNADEMIINFSYGLGEAIVSGLVTPDTTVICKKENRILSLELGAKEKMIVYAEQGGVEERDTPQGMRSRSVLTQGQLGELAELGRRLEAHYAVPQDVEWACASGKLYLLQSRPITTMAAHEEVDEGDYYRTMFIEIFPDPLSPLFLSVIEPLFKSMLDFTFEAWGFHAPQEERAIGVFYNQPYFNRRYIERALMPLSPPVRAPLTAQIVNPFSEHNQGPSGELSLAFIGMLLRMIGFIHRFPKQLPGLLERYHQEIERVSSLPLETLSDREIVAAVRRLVFDSGMRLLNHDFLMIAVIGRTYRLLSSLLRRRYVTEADELCAKLISGVTGNVTMETNKRLWDLAQIAKASPAVTSLLQKHEPGDVLPHLERDPESKAFLGALRRFLEEYGHREIRLDILYPTWVEDPTPVLAFVRAYLDADESQSPHAQQQRLVNEREVLTATVLQELEKGPMGRLLLSPLFRWLLTQSQVHTRERDTMHFELTRLFPPFRRFLLELGARWKGMGLLGHQEDIFFMSLDELSAMAEDPTPALDLVTSRRAEYEDSQNRRWPNAVLAGQEIYSETGLAEGTDEDFLTGIAGSPGVATGVARLIRGPEEFGRLEKGDILVAPLTNPVWTPLFAIASGVITEVGGILSHGAIVAREYGIPAVMSLPGATRRISEGQTITVDGNHGRVFMATGGA